MKIPHYANQRKLGINMTPMIDVVFLLIIFFLVSSHLVRQETQIELPLPVAQSGVDDVPKDVPRITLNVKSDGQILLAGREIAVERLADRLRDLRSKEGDQIEVRIRTSRDAAYTYVEPILTACTRAGIWNVSFAVYSQERSK